MFMYLYNELMKFKSSKGSVDSDPGLSQSCLYVCDLFELDVTLQVIYIWILQPPFYQSLSQVSLLSLQE